MQNFLRKMLLWACMLVPMITMAQEFNYSCDFEDDESASSWTYLNGTATNKWIRGTAVHSGEGTQSLYISSSETGSIHEYDIRSNSYAMAYCTLALDSGNYEYGYEWLCAGEGRYDYMRVLLVPESATLVENSDNGISYDRAPSGWIALDGGEKLNGSDIWNVVSGTVNITASGSYKLLVYWRNDYSGGNQPPAAIDNVVFRVPTCPIPREVTVSGIVDDYATISWQGSAEVNSWLVTYYPSDESSTSESAVSLRSYETNVTITGLESNKEYVVVVQSDCAGEESLKAITRFRTACGTITLPYSENYESCEVGETPFCWTNYNNGNISVVNKDDSKVVKFAAGATLVTPKIPLAGNMIEMTFMLNREGGSSGSMQIGFVSDLANIEDMTIVKTFFPTETNRFFECEVDFSSMGTDVTDEGYIVFKQVDNTSNYYYYWIDDVLIRQRSNCRRPDNVTISNITYDGVKVMWNGVEGCDLYEVAYGHEDDLADVGIQYIDSIRGTSVDITGLNADMRYYVWVRSLCGTEVSEWRRGGEFYTQEACASLSSVEVVNVGVHGASISWSYNTAVGRPATAVEIAYREMNSEDEYDTIVTTDGYYIFSGLEAHTLYELKLRTICSTDTADVVSVDFKTMPCGHVIAGGESTTSNFPSYMWNDYSYTQMLYKASELSGVSAINGVAFRYEDDYSEPTRTLNVYLGNVTTSELTSDGVVPDSLLIQVGTNVSFTIDKGWCKIAFDTTFVYDGTSNLLVAIDDNTAQYTSNRYVYYHAGGVSLYANGDLNIVPSRVTEMNTFNGVPDIVFCEDCVPTCEAPILIVGGVGTTSADLVWTAGGTDARWAVQYKLSSDEDWTQFVTTTDTTATIDALQAGMYYDLRVGSICGSDTLYSYVSVSTQCTAVAVPYMEDFESSTLNPCIVMGNSNSDSEYGIPRLIRGKIDFRRTAYGYMILPEFEAPLNTLRLSYTLIGYQNNIMVVLAGTDPNDWGTFVPVDTVTIVTDEYSEEHYIYFNHYQGNGHYIAIQSLSSSTYLDDVTVEVMPRCATPMDVEVSQVSSTSAVVSWDGSNGASDGWLIKCSPVNGDAAIEDVCTECSYMVADLMPDMEYEVMVYNICDEDTIPALFNAHFRTLCGPLELPFVESFETKQIYQFPSCWTLYSGESEVYFRHTTDGERSLKLDNSAIVISPKVPLAGNSIALDFLLKHDSPEAGKIVVGFTTDNINLLNMQVVDTINPVDNDVHLYELNFSNIESTEEGYIVWKQIDMATGWDVDYPEYYLDYVYIRQISSYARPSALHVSNISYDKALLSWPAVDNSTGYEVMYGERNDMFAESNMTMLSSEDSITITGLQGSTTYYAWVRALYGIEQSEWRAANAFTTQIGCARLADVNVVQTTTTGISINWSYDDLVGAPATQVEIDWKDNADSVYNTIVTDKNYLILDGLEPGTTYQLSLSTICSNDTAEAYVVYVTTNSCGLILEDTVMHNESEVPANCNWNYSYAQMLYPASDLVGVDTIRSISFEWNSDIVTTRNWDVYMGHTMNTQLNTLKVLPVDSMTLVNTAVDVKLERGWCKITLSSPYVYHSDSNLVVAIDDNTGSYPRGSGKYFLTHEGVSIYYHNDNINPSPAVAREYRVLNQVPNIMFSNTCAADLCEAPLLALDEMTDTSALLLWSGANEGDSWQVEYKSGMDVEWTMVYNHVTDTFTTINHLTPSTYYQFRVGTNCNEGIQYSMVEGYTNCGVVVVPYTENFSSQALNPCWVYGNSSLENEAPTLMNGALYMSNDSNSFAVLPEISDSIATLHVGFTLKSDEANKSMVVMVGIDANDINTFVAIDTFNVNDPDMEFSYVCDLDSYQGDGYFIAFYSPTGGVYLDNVNVYTDIVCNRPINLLVSNITDSSANLSWVGTATAYELSYHERGNTSWTSINVVGNSYTLGSLQASTTYEWRVRACCGELNSEWDTCIFTTLAPPCDKPTMLNTDSVTYNSVILTWVGTASNYELNYRLEGAVSWVIVTLSDNSYALSGLLSDTVYEWRVASQCGSMFSDWSTATFRTLEKPCIEPSEMIVENITYDAATISWQGSVAAYEFGFRVRGDEDWTTIDLNDNSYTLMGLQPATTYECRVRSHCGEIYSDWTDVVFTTLELACDALVIVVSNITGLDAMVSWQAGEHHTAWEVNVFNTTMNEVYDVSDVNYTISGLYAATEYHVAVRARCSETIYSDWSDTITFTTLECMPVTNVGASEITSHGAMINWVIGGGESEWIINYGEADFPQGGGEFVTTDENHYMLTNLLPNTEYDVYVRAICGVDFNSTWSSPVCRFRTMEENPQGVDGVEGDFRFSIYPNPASGSTTIMLNGVEENVVISVVDMNGRTISIETLECGREKIIDVTGLAQGTYFVRVIGDGINSVRKLIVR